MSDSLLTTEELIARYGSITKAFFAMLEAARRGDTIRIAGGTPLIFDRDEVANEVFIAEPRRRRFAKLMKRLVRGPQQRRHT